MAAIHPAAVLCGVVRWSGGWGVEERTRVINVGHVTSISVALALGCFDVRSIDQSPSFRFRETNKKYATKYRHRYAQRKGT